MNCCHPLRSCLTSRTLSSCVFPDLILFILFSMLLRYAFSRLRSTQVAVVHCSAQTSSRHVLQKLSQTCLLLSSNTGRVFRPKDCENLVLYLKDINLPKPDKWGTSNLTAFLQQVKKTDKLKSQSMAGCVGNSFDTSAHSQKLRL